MNMTRAHQARYNAAVLHVAIPCDTTQRFCTRPLFEGTPAEGVPSDRVLPDGALADGVFAEKGARRV
jgi:hypothetical protein